MAETRKAKKRPAPARSKGVGRRSASWQRQYAARRMVNDLCGGTPAMRAAGQLWLPKQQVEKDPAYIRRLSTSFLYPGLRTAIDSIVAKPFSRDITLDGELPEGLEKLWGNCDRNGTTMHEFGRACFKDAVKYGIAFALVEWPNTAAMVRRMSQGDAADQAASGDLLAGGEALSLKGEQALDVRPYLVRIAPDNVLGGRYEERPGGGKRLVQLRILELRSEAQGAYGSAEVEHVRVLTPGAWELWRKLEPEVASATGTATPQPSNYAGIPLPPGLGDDGCEYELVDAGETRMAIGRTDSAPMSEIQLEVLQLDDGERGDLEARPPLEDLAWTNICHWQSASDQRNLLSVARVPILFRKGLTEEEADKSLEIGATKSQSVTGEHADMKYVEHTGAAIGAGQADLDKLEDEMEVAGMRPFAEGSAGSQTATGRVLDEARAQSEVQEWVRRCEQFLRALLRRAAGFFGLELPEEVKVDIKADFWISAAAIQECEFLLKMRMAGELSRETFLQEVRRRGKLAETLDVGAEIDRIDSEGPALADVPARGAPAAPASGKQKPQAPALGERKGAAA